MFALSGGVQLYWTAEGPADGAPVVLLHSIGTHSGMWDRVVPHLLSGCRVVRVDMRGHGASDAPPGDYDLSTMARDVLAVLDEAGIGAAMVAGVSLGGMVAMELALLAPERVRAAALICTSAKMDADLWRQRIKAVRDGGIAAIAEVAMSRFLSPDFARAHPSLHSAIERGLLSTDADGYAGAGAAIRDMDLEGRLASIEAPVVVVTGDKDVSTPAAEHGERIAARIPGAKLARVNTGHLAPVEAPSEIASHIRHLARPREGATDAAAETLYQAGLATRRRVLGDDWVDRALAARTPFSADFQSFITRMAWHEIWSRPGLDERTRRLLAIAITAALGRWEEFALHVRSGLTRDGFSQDELRETLMQLAIYAGLPAANTAFSEAGAIVETLDDPKAAGVAD